MASVLLAVDIGTQGTKTGVLDQDGTILGDAFEESKLYHETSASVHQEPEEIYQSVINTIGQAVAKSRVDPKQVAGIGIGGQMAGILGIDDNYQAVTYYDSWLDTRCEPYIKSMQQQAGAKVHELSGAAPSYSHGPKILWWKEQRPEQFQATRKWVVPVSYVVGRLAGLSADDAYIDYTHVVFACFADARNLTWSQELLDAFGVPREKLPRIVAPTDVVGELTAEAAAACGLRAGIPIVAGVGDQPAGALGAGIVEDGMVFDVAGTASVFAAGLDRYVADVETRTLMTFRSVIPDNWIALAYINGGGLSLRWFRDNFAAEEKRLAEERGISPYALLDEQASRLPPGSDDLTFIPHLGGRVCPPIPDLRGFWHGFSWGHTKAHFYRSILEGIAYEYDYYKTVLQKLTGGIDITEVRITGGGSRSKFWNQIKADVLNVTYRELQNHECALLGAALVAGHGAGVYRDLRAATQDLVKPIGLVSPDAERHQAYAPRSAKYRELIPQLLPTFAT